MTPIPSVVCVHSRRWIVEERSLRYPWHLLLLQQHQLLSLLLLQQQQLPSLPLLLLLLTMVMVAATGDLTTRLPVAGAERGSATGFSMSPRMLTSSTLAGAWLVRRS